LNAIKNNVRLIIQHAEPIDRLIESQSEPKKKHPIRVLIQELHEQGVMEKLGGGFSAGISVKLPPRDPTEVGEALTGFERARLQKLNLEILNRLLFADFLHQPSTKNFCDPFITAAKPWRDYYHYAPDGTCLGWTRFVDGKKMELNTDGYLILEMDSLERTQRAQTTIYQVNKEKRRNRKELNWLAGDEIVEYTYQSAEDYVGTPSAKTKMKINQQPPE
jgi:hypothetical protein